jgi:hypothetical protein
MKNKLFLGKIFGKAAVAAVLTFGLFPIGCASSGGLLSTAFASPTDGGENPAPAPETAVNPNPDVYVAGYVYNNGRTVAALWKNGVATNLTDGTHNAEAKSVYVSGSDVYVAGFDGLPVYGGPAGQKTATLWKNGAATSLTGGTFATDASSVFVSGKDVYVAGYETREDMTQSTRGIYIAKVWKNGAATNLTGDTAFAFAESVFVSGADVYAAGYEVLVANKRTLTLWKNGIATRLSAANSSTVESGSVFVSGKDVYVAGRENYHATLWKNGTAIRLSESTKSEAQSVYVYGGDVYVAGTEDDHATLWKNGVRTRLTGYGTARAYSVFVK